MKKQSPKQVELADIQAIEVEHRNMVTALVKPGANILSTLTPEKCNLLHMAVGVSGECAELLEATTIENVIEELGDIEFYLEGVRQQLVSFGGDYTPFEPNESADYIKQLSIQSGALLDVVKKYVIYDKPLESVLLKMIVATQAIMYNLISFYNSFGIQRQEVLDANITKLLKGKNARYAAGSYSDKAASDRADKEGVE